MNANVVMQLTKIDSSKREHILKLFALEDREFSKRASYTIENNPNDLTFKIEAKDAVALRSCMNAITKTLSIYEQAEKLIKEDE